MIKLLLTNKSIYFIDESNINCKMRKIRGRALKGQRIVNPEKIESTLSLTLLAAINWEGTLDYIILDGSSKAKDFTGFICDLIKKRGLE